MDGPAQFLLRLHESRSSVRIRTTGRDINGKERLALDRAMIRSGNLIRVGTLQQAQEDNQGIRLGGVVLLDKLILADLERLSTRDGLHVVKVQKDEVALVGGQGVEVIECDIFAVRALGSFPQKSSVGPQKRVPVQGASGIVVDDLLAKPPGEHGVVVCQQGHVWHQGARGRHEG